jgi:hypothetical protein
MMALRLVIERGKLLEAASSQDKPKIVMGLSHYTDEDLEFWSFMLTYYRHGVQPDDLEIWGEGQIEYYRKYGNY